MKTTLLGTFAILATLAIGCAEPSGTPEQVGGSAAAQSSNSDAEPSRALAAKVLTADAVTSMRIASSRNEFTAWRYDVTADGFRIVGERPEGKYSLNPTIAYALQTSGSGSRVVGVAVGKQTGSFDEIDDLLTTARSDLASAMQNVGEVTDPTDGAGLGNVDHRCSDLLVEVLTAALATATFVSGAAWIALETGVGAAYGGVAAAVSFVVATGSGAALVACKSPAEQ